MSTSKRRQRYRTRNTQEEKVGAKEEERQKAFFGEAPKAAGFFSPAVPTTAGTEVENVRPESPEDLAPKAEETEDERVARTAETPVEREADDEAED